MNLKETLKDSLSFPLSNPVRMITLGVFSAFSILILPLILVTGYMMRIIEYTSQGKREMPEFNDWVNMFVDGIKYMVVSFCYLLPGSIFLGLGIFWIILEFITSHIDVSSSAYVGTQIFSPDLIWGLSPLPLLVISIGIILYIVGYFLQIMAIPQMVYKNNLVAAFDIKSLLHNIRLVSWKKYLASAFIFSFMVFLVSLINLFLKEFLNSYGLLGYILSIIVGSILINSYVYCFQGRFMGLIYPGEVENEKSESERKPRFQTESTED